MLVGICQIDLLIYESRSLKEKRRVIKSLVEKMTLRFNISIMEVDNQDIWNKSTLGISLIGLNRRSIDKNIDKIINFIENDYRVEILQVFKDII